VKNLPAYVDLTSVFCGVKDESWVAAIKARNYSVLEVQGLISAIDRYYAYYINITHAHIVCYLYYIAC